MKKVISLFIVLLLLPACSVFRKTTKSRDLQLINIGTTANDHTGESIRSFATKANIITSELNRIGITDIQATAPEINVLHNLDINVKNIRDIETIPKIYSAAGDTSNYPTPGKIGNIYVDTSAGDVYISVKAIRHDGWIKLN